MEQKYRKKIVGTSVFAMVVATFAFGILGFASAVNNGNGNANGQGHVYGASVTLCHIPPGNAANAHTLTVGASAAQAHYNHGDTPGACAPVVQSVQAPKGKNK